jgi:hypothetical protein
MRKRDSSIDRIAGSRGATLIEVVVAAVVLGLAFVGTTSMIASGRGLESGEFLRGQASRIASNTLEDPVLGAKNYTALPAGTVSRNDSMRSEPGQTIFATVLITVSAPQNAAFQDPVSGFSPGQSVEYKRVEAKVLWPSSAPQDSFSLSKLISDIP